MMRKTAKIAAALLLALSLGACNSGTGNQQVATDAQSAEETPAAVEETPEPQEEKEEEKAEEYDPNVDCIDLTLEQGSIRFDHVEKANEGLTDDEGALIFVFDFTNKQAVPSQVQSVFRFQFFQNGAELSNSSSYSSRGGDQYELCGAFFNEAMKDGTVTFGKIVVPKDDSPITVMVSQNGAALEENYQMMEVAITDGTDESEGDADADDASEAEGDSDADDAAKEAAELEEAEDAAPKQLNVGDTISNDDWEVTFVRAEVTDEVLPTDTSGYYYSYTANEGTVFLDMVFDVKCLASKTSRLTKALGGARATYAGKYEFDTFELYYDNDTSIHRANNLAFDPLQTIQIHHCVCNIPEEAASSDEPLTNLIIIEGEIYEYTYR